MIEMEQGVYIYLTAQTDPVPLNQFNNGYIEVEVSGQVATVTTNAGNLAFELKALKGVFCTQGKPAWERAQQEKSYSTSAGSARFWGGRPF